MTARTACFAVGREQRLAALGRMGVEAAARWSRRGNRELIEVQCGELRRHEIRLAAHVAETVRGRDRKLAGIVETRIVERAFALHLEHGDERIPMRYGAPA